MTPSTASTLQRDVDAVVSATDASQWDAAIDALDQLEADVASARAAGGLSDERAAQIRAIRQRVLEDLQRIRLSSPPLPTTQTTPSTETNDNARTATGTTTRAASPTTRTRAKDGGGKSKEKWKYEDRAKTAAVAHMHYQGEDGANHQGKTRVITQSPPHTPGLSKAIQQRPAKASREPTTAYRQLKI